jgi:hypothetical protein
MASQLGLLTQQVHRQSAMFLRNGVAGHKRRSGQVAGAARESRRGGGGQAQRHAIELIDAADGFDMAAVPAAQVKHLGVQPIERGCVSGGLARSTIQAATHDGPPCLCPGAAPAASRVAKAFRLADSVSNVVA